MTAGQRRYLLVEMAVSAAINAAFSLAFALLIFGRAASVPVAGAHGLVVDALPQSFMVALMSALIPALVALGRSARGDVHLAGLRASTLRRRHLVRRAVVTAGVVAIAAVGLHALLLPILTAPSWRFAPMLAYKIGYGALLGAGVTALTLRRLITVR